MSKNESKYAFTSIPAELPPSYALHQHACLTLNGTDRLRVIRFPEPIIDTVRQAILTSWHRGLQTARPYAGAYEFKLRGNPWLCQGVEAVESRAMMISILSALHHHGWYLLTSTDVPTKQYRDLLIFQLGVPPAPTSFFALSFNEWDKLRLIGAPPELISAVQETLAASAIQSEEWVYSRTAYQFKLRGYPWITNGDKAVTSPMKLLALLDCFTVFGWQLHASIDMSTYFEGCDPDTWFFRRTNQ